MTGRSSSYCTLKSMVAKCVFILFPAGLILHGDAFFLVLVWMMINLITWFFVAEDHPLYLGCCALSANDYVHVCIEKADLIINVGHDVVEKPPFIMRYVIKSFNVLVRMIWTFKLWIEGSGITHVQNTT